MVVVVDDMVVVVVDTALQGDKSLKHPSPWGHSPSSALGQETPQVVSATAQVDPQRIVDVASITPPVHAVIDNASQHFRPPVQSASELQSFLQ